VNNGEIVRLFGVKKMKTEESQKGYESCKLSIIFFDVEDVVRTSTVDDGYGSWDDEDAVGGF
jgi:hypothetical protein